MGVDSLKTLETALNQMGAYCGMTWMCSHRFADGIFIHHPERLADSRQSPLNPHSKLTEAEHCPAAFLKYGNDL